MEIVLSALSLSAPGGMQSYVITIAPQLERLGHEVTLYAPELGVMADVARSRGLRVARWEHELPDHCDAVISQDGVTLLSMADRYPDAVRIIVVHSSEYDVHLPPGIDGIVSRVVVMNDAVERRIRAMSAVFDVERLRQPIDTERHFAVGTLPARPHRVLLLGNYLNVRDRDAFVQVCTQSGLSCQHVGVYGQLLSDPVDAINEADIVVGQGRSVLDAMACGRAAWIYGPSYGDGWVTSSNYASLEADGFRGRATDAVLDAASFGRALEDYQSSMGTVNRKLIALHHSVHEHVNGLVRVIETAPVGKKVDAPLRELARTIRTQFGAQAGMETVTHQLHAVHERLVDAIEESESFRIENARLVQEVASLERRWEDLLRSRRWRATSLALLPLDFVRGKRRRH
jgi:hypothetical protein